MDTAEGGVGHATREALWPLPDIVDSIPPSDDSYPPLYICFAAGTPVRTKDGLVSIENIERGDAVWAFDLHIGQWELRPVEELQVRSYNGEVALVEFDDGLRVEATASHPVWVVSGPELASRPVVRTLLMNEREMIRGGRWVEAGNLRSGDRVMTLDGRVIHVKRLTRTAGGGGIL